MKKLLGWHITTDHYEKAPTLQVRRGISGKGMRIRLLPWRVRGSSEPSWWGRPPIDRSAKGFKLRLGRFTFGVRHYSVATHFAFGLIDVSILHGLN